MGEVVNLQKQKELQSLRVQAQETEEADRLAELERARREAANDRSVRMEQIRDRMNEFGLEFRNEWSKKEELDENFLRKSSAWVRRFVKSEDPPYYSMNSFAYGDETKNKNEKRSSTAGDLMDSLSEWYEFTSNKKGMADPSECVERLLELSQASMNYCLTHEKVFFYKNLGKGRVMIAEKVRKMTSKYLYSMLSEDDKMAIASNEGADFRSGESDKTIAEDLKRAAKAYFDHVRQIAQKCKGHLPGEMLNKRLSALLVNERKIKLYRDKYPYEDQRDPLINDMIREYEECLSWQRILNITKKEGQKEENLDDVIDEHLVQEGEIESFKKDKIDPKEVDEELQPEQLKGLEDIDNWLLRNYQNGGVAGAVLSFLKNPNEDFVRRVLSMSKRERLHMYYLVENKKRKDSNMLDVGLSQNYVPTLKGFKDQMIATKFKFWKRATGDYTYMHKLSEAFQVTSQYRKEIKAMAEIEREKKQQLETIDRNTKENAPVDAATERLQKMLLLKGALEEYSRNLQSAKKADKKKKTAAENICKESAAYCEQLMKDLIKLDNSVGKEELYNRKADTNETTVIEGSSKINLIGKVPGGTVTGVTKTGSFFHAKWDLESAGWTQANLWTGSVTEAIGGVTNIIGGVTSLVALCKTGDQMAGAEIAEKTFQLTQSLTTATQNAFNIKNLVETGGAIIKTAQQTQAQEIVGASFAAAGAVINAGIFVSKAIGVNEMAMHGEKAGDYFRKKRAALLKNGKDKLTAKQKRELKYEKNMMMLQQDLENREDTKMKYSAVSAGISMVSILVPVVGFANIAVSIVGSIHDGIQVSKLRTKLFDSFFNMDALAEKVTEKRYKRDRKNKAHNQNEDPKERVKEDIRSRVAAYAGFCDMKTATEYICRNFARLIREKLFGEGIEDAERKGYIDFVKAINLRYNKDKGLPDENVLVRKLTAQ